MKIKFLTKSIGLIGVFLLIILPSCKKESNNNSGDYRISSIANGNSSTYFTYDDQKRLLRIDYDISRSLRAQYSPAGVILQYYNGEVPDAANKYEFNILNDLITTGRRYLTGGIVEDYTYTYDDKQRLSKIISRAGDAGGFYNRHEFSFSYDEKDIFRTSTFFGARLSPSDSSWASFTYFETLPSFNLNNLGFDYFGNAPVGVEYTSSFEGQLVVPFPFIGQSIYPGKWTIKEESVDGKSKNPINFGQWEPVGSHRSYNENDYEHDQQGRLTKYGGFQIEWK